MPHAIIGAAIGAGGNIASSLIGRGGNSSTSTTTPILSPGQQQVQALLANIFKTQFARGVKVPQAERNQGRLQINNTYDAIGHRMESNLASRGFSDSGKLASGFKDIEIARANDFQNLEADLKGDAEQKFLQMLGLAQNFTNPQGSTTTQTGPSGPGVGSAVFGGAQNFATSLWLQKMLGGGLGGSGNTSQVQRLLSQLALDS